MPLLLVAALPISSAAPVGSGAPGSVDESFEATADGQVNALALQVDGKLLIAGAFTFINGTPRNQFARLNADGTLDAAFDPPLARPGYGPNVVTAMVLQPDGRILIAGLPAAQGAFGGGGDYVARFTTTGRLDPSFTTYVHTNENYAWSRDVALGLQTDGRIVVATENYIQPQPTTQCRLFGLRTDGLPDPDFHGPTEIDLGVASRSGTFARQADGKLLLGLGNGMVRLNYDGSIDPTFQFTTELDSITGSEFGVNSIAIQPDGWILATGTGTARLHPNGNLDKSFSLSPGGNKIVLQSNGQMLVAGGTITQLNSDGSLDTAFPVVTLTGSASDMVVQPDRRILIGGLFSQVNGLARTNMARIFADQASLSIQTYAGSTISGAIGRVYSIEYVTDLAQTNVPSAWRCLEFLQLPSSPFLWIDKSAPETGQRFYRSVMFAAPTNMVFIPPGTFRMGSPPDEVDRNSNEGPQTDVTISRGFWMGKYEVTQGEYLALIGSNPSIYQSPYDPSRPVENLDWSDATNYCAMLTQLERAAGRIPTNSVYRLPTEAEWEYACRARTSTRFSHGEDQGYTNLVNYAWYLSTSGTSSVGQKLPNPWGLYDMHGNVWEHCQDWYGLHSGGIALDPPGPATGSNHVVRGGDFGSGANTSNAKAARCRSASRAQGPPTGGKGFRVVLVPGQ